MTTNRELDLLEDIAKSLRLIASSLNSLVVVMEEK